MLTCASMVANIPLHGTLDSDISNILWPGQPTPMGGDVEPSALQTVPPLPTVPPILSMETPSAVVPQVPSELLMPPPVTAMPDAAPTSVVVGETVLPVASSVGVSQDEHNVRNLSSQFKRKVSVSADMPMMKKSPSMTPEIPTSPGNTSSSGGSRPSSVTQGSMPLTMHGTAMDEESRKRREWKYAARRTRRARVPGALMEAAGGWGGLPVSVCVLTEICVCVCVCGVVPRLARNRMSAQMSRARKRQLIATLEAQVQQLQAEKEQLKAMCQQLSQENQTYKAKERARAESGGAMMSDAMTLGGAEMPTPQATGP